MQTVNIWDTLDVQLKINWCKGKERKIFEFYFMLHYFQILQAVLELLWEQNHVFCWQNIEHRNHLSSVYRYLQCNVPHYSHKVSLTIRKPIHFAISWSIAHIVLSLSYIQLIHINIVLLYNSYMHHFVKKLHRCILLLHYFYR